MNKVGIFGGTFDPVHNEHILMAKRAVNELGLDKLIVVPTFISPHKIGKNVAAGNDRFEMLNLAFKNEQKIEVSSYELDKGGVSYSFETILHFKNEYKNATLYFLMGSDMLENFPTWKNPQIICDNVELVLTERKGSGFNDEALKQNILQKFGKEVISSSFYGEDLSGTKVRVYKKLGFDISKYVPQSVLNYLIENDVYGNDYYYDFVKSKLKPSRLQHTANVILTALKLCKSAGVSPADAETAALLHDVAKYLNPKDYGFIVESDVPDSVVHQFLGAYIVKNILHEQNDDIVNAVKYHTTGRADMSQLEKLVFVADLIEPSRTFDGVDDIRNAVYENFDNGFAFAVQQLYKFLLEGGGEIYKLTKICADYYKGDKL